MRQAVESQVLNPQYELGEQGLRQILAVVVEEVRNSISPDIDGADVLHGLLSAPWLQSLLRVYECLQKFLKSPPPPAFGQASGLSFQLLMDLRGPGCSQEAQELHHLLRQPHLQALLWAHDSVAQRDFDPVLPPVPDDLPDDEEATRIVCLVKNNQPLGATIKRNEVSGEIFIARIIHGGLAERSGLLHAGDRVVEVNGFPVDGMEPEQVIQIVQARSQGTIMFKVVPITERPVHSQTMLYVRAMADYCPLQDPAIPCADAGVSFKRGDILEIVDQSDALWWQARTLHSHTACAGLVPSSSLLRRKQRELWWSQPYLPQACMHTLSTVEEEEDLLALEDKCVEADEEAFESEELREDADNFSSSHGGLYLVGFRWSLRLCRRRPTHGPTHGPAQPTCHSRCPSSCYSALNLPYEEVVRYQRQPQAPPRLIALLGPSGVGVNELRRRLIESDPTLFQSAVPHTTRAAKGYEEAGREYHFTSRQTFDSMALNNRFVEYGEYKGNLYGTSVDSVKEVLSSGKVCVVDIEPHAIQAVRSPELKAYIIFIKPPPLQRLRATRVKASVTTNYYVNRPFKDEDYQEMEEASRRMEAQFGQFFDLVLVNDLLHDCCMQLRAVASRVQQQPQWVPASWIRPSAQP